MWKLSGYQILCPKTKAGFAQGNYSGTDHTHCPGSCLGLPGGFRTGLLLPTAEAGAPQSLQGPLVVTQTKFHVVQGLTRAFWKEPDSQPVVYGPVTRFHLHLWMTQGAVACAYPAMLGPGGEGTGIEGKKHFPGSHVQAAAIRAQ